MRILFVLIFVLSGCAPIMTYQEIDDAYQAAETPKEKEKYRKQLEDYETLAEEARRYYEYRDLCDADPHRMWYCDFKSGPIPVKIRTMKTLDHLVKAYRKEKGSCGCGYR